MHRLDRIGSGLRAIRRDRSLSTRAQMRGERERGNGGHSCLPFDEARRGVFIGFESEGVTIYTMQGKE